MAFEKLVQYAYWPSEVAKTKGHNLCVVHLLVLLWKHGVIAYPAGFIWNRGRPKLPAPSDSVYGDVLTPLFAHLVSGTPEFLAVYEGARDRDYKRFIRYVFLACGRVVEAGDIDGNILDRLAVHMPRPPKGRNTLVCDALRALQMLAYPDVGHELAELRRRIPPSYRASLRAYADLTIDRFANEEEDLPAETEWVHFNATPVVSAITGRTVLVNCDAAKYAVLPDFSTDRLAAARANWESEASRMGRSLAVITAATLQRIAACFRARSRQGFAAAVERLVARRSVKLWQYTASVKPVGDFARAGDASRITEALLLLWKHDLLVFPAGEIWGATTVRFGTMGALTEHFYGPLTPVIRAMDSSKRWGPEGRRVPRLIFLACGGIHEVGDLESATLKLLVPFAAAAEQGRLRLFPRSVNTLCDQLRAAQLRVYADDVEKFDNIPQSYRPVFRPSEVGRSDPKFAWASALDPRVEQWRTRVATYVATLPNRVTRRAEITTFNALLDYVHEHTDVQADPLAFCRRAYTPSNGFEAWFRGREPSALHANATLRRIGLFFRWLLEHDAIDEDGYVLRDYHNPCDPDDLGSVTFNRGQTNRTAIPVRYLRMIREIIEENDYAWPRSIQLDYIEWINPESGSMERVWSPVRAYFYLLRLHLPLRGMQVRLLDSGEGDPEVFRPEQGGWVPNESRWAPSKGDKKSPAGFVRRIWDHTTGRHFNGLHITTNKTADRVAGFAECGYEIPWENSEVIALFTKLRDWQERYNPSQRPMTRSELSDKSLSASEDVALRLQKLHFLFRDPANAAFPTEPVSVGRLSKFWYLLIAELERRLAVSGVTSYDGSPIRLITKYVHGTVPSGTIFDPHSLRVAGLTALAAAGVPLHVLSEFVAGHATVLMTLYYLKPGASEITRLLDDAVQKVVELEQRQWAAFLKDQSIDLLTDLAAFNSPEGAAQAAATQSGLWSPMDDGVCPNGGTMCGVGGPLLDSRTTYHGSVPGGARNCALCRFFVTGPAYLAGLVAKFNATAGAIREAIMRVQALSAKRRELARVQLEAERNYRPFGEYRQLARAEEELAKAEGEVDLLSQTWMAQLQLIRRCEALLEKRMRSCDAGKGLNAMVLNGTAIDLRVSLKNCSEFDLWDRICESAEFYNGIDARLPALRRGRLFDAMLSREGQPAVFATLTDAQILAVGNEATRLLRAQVGTTDLNALIEGQTTLSALGVEELLSRVTSAASHPVIVTPPVRSTQSTFADGRCIAGADHGVSVLLP